MSMDDRTVPAAVNLKVWVGVLDPALERRVDYLSSGTDFPFGVDALGIAVVPDARALSSAVNDVFGFHTAESGVPLEEPLAQVNDRLSTLEDTMSKIAAGFKIMMERQQDAPTTPPEPRSRPGLLKAKAKDGARPASAAAPAGGRVTFADLNTAEARQKVTTCPKHALKMREDSVVGPVGQPPQATLRNWPQVSM